MPLPKFHAVNSLEGAAWLDSLKQERAASAGIAIHMAWLEHSSSFELFKGDRLLADTPVDMLLLYKAAAAAFDPWPTPPQSGVLPKGGRVVNLAKAQERLRAVSDPREAALACYFASKVIEMSAESPNEQDLGYLLELFLRSMQQEGVIDRIVSGEIKRKEIQLADPDFWR